MGKKPTSVSIHSSNEELHGAARSGDLKAVQAICTNNPLSINSRDRHSRTPLHLAAWSGHAEVVNYLCKNKADIGAAAMDDMGAIHFAAQKGHLEVIKILHASGVSIKSYNRKGMTPLHYAAQGSNLELVKYLMKKGASIVAKNKAGKTAVDVASNEEIQKFLVEWRSEPGKVGLIDDEEGEKTAQKQSSEVKTEGFDGNAALHVNETAEDEKDENLKRKGEDESKENQQETKKQKVSLNHLLATDDTPEEEEIM